MAGRILHAQLHLLGRQVVDHGNGHFLCKVDDVELDLDADTPVLTALLSGPQAFGARFPGRTGRFIRAVHSRLHDQPDPGPNVIPAVRIAEIDSAVRIENRHGDLHLDGFGRWVEQRIIAKIPGSGDAPQ